MTGTTKCREEGLGYYEKRLCLLVFLSSIPNSLNALQVLVTQFTPNYHCNISDVAEYFQAKNESGAYGLAVNVSLPLEEDEFGKLVRSKCRQYNFTCQHDYCKLDRENVSIIPCKSMYFEGPETSAVTEFNLVCGRAWLKPIFTSFIFWGTACGALIAGNLSDRFGRRRVFLVFTYWSFITVFLLSFVQDEISYAIMFTVANIGNLINYAVAAVIGAEMIPKTYRAFMYFFLTMGYSVGYLLMSPISYFFRDWRWFLRFSGLLGILYIPYIWLIDETPRWLVVSGKSNNAQKILNKIAKINKAQPADVKDFTVDVPLGVWKTFLQIKRQPFLLFRLAICCYIWLVISIAYNTAALNNNNLNGNRFLNLFFASLAEIASAFIYYVLVAKLGRCLSYILSSSGLAICMIGAIVGMNWESSVVIILTMAGKLMVATAWAVIYVHTLEMFPTKTRQSILFCVVLCAKFGGMISPFLIHAGESGNMKPFIVTAGLVLTTSFLCIFLPETSDANLPQTVNEAISMKGFWKEILHKIRRIKGDQTNNSDTEQYNQVVQQPI